MKKTELHLVLARSFRDHWRITTTRFAKLGLSSAQPKILHFLSEHSGAKQKEIAENCNIEPATATSILNGMEQAQLIKRQVDDTDRRVVRTFLTEKGQSMVEKIEEVFTDIEAIIYNDLSNKEITQLHNLLERMSDSIERATLEND